jgi:hypothetical protein
VESKKGKRERGKGKRDKRTWRQRKIKMGEKRA